MMDRDDNFPDPTGPKKLFPPTPYKFTSDELRVLKQCNKESFFKRSLPLSTILGAGVYFGVKAGYFKPNLKYGAIPKVVSAVILGYFLGKLSYQRRCAEMIMQLPNSELGAMLRNKKNKGGFQDPLGIDLPTTFGSPMIDKNEVYPDHQHTFTDLDTDRPYDKGLDDSFRPSLDRTIPIRDEDYTMPPNSSQTITSYEDLRRQNREEYEQRRTKPYRSIVTPEEVPSSLPPKARHPGPYQESWDRPKNIYGDVFEK